jgi:ribonuclease HII
MPDIIVGIDEAGRGPLAGRVYAAAVILDPDKPIKGLSDSKKLTEKKRDALFDEIINKSLSHSISYASHEEIDKINILQASFLAMHRTIDTIEHKFDLVLIDGRDFPFEQYKGEAIIKGDSKIPEIMAASILAKVSRDRHMMEMDKLYPEYQFAKHKGYPTKLHRDLLTKHGPCPIHRKSFRGVKEFFEKTLFDF